MLWRWVGLFLWTDKTWRIRNCSMILGHSLNKVVVWNNRCFFLSLSCSSCLQCPRCDRKQGRASVRHWSRRPNGWRLSRPVVQARGGKTALQVRVQKIKKYVRRILFLVFFNLMEEKNQSPYNHAFFRFSFDVRGRDSEDGKHWSANEPFGNRAFFRTGTDPTFLMINDVRLEVSEPEIKQAVDAIPRRGIDFLAAASFNCKLGMSSQNAFFQSNVVSFVKQLISWLS